MRIINRHMNILFSVLLLLFIYSCVTSTTNADGPIFEHDRSLSMLKFNNTGQLVEDWSETAPSAVFIEPILEISNEDLERNGEVVSKVEVNFGDGTGWEDFDVSIVTQVDGSYVPSTENENRISHTYLEPGTFALVCTVTLWDLYSYHVTETITILPAPDEAQ